MTTVSARLEMLSQRLMPLSDTPDLDAQVLLARIMNRSRSWLAAHPETRLDPEPAAALEAAVQRLEQGEPLPYVLGEWEFYKLMFDVTPDVLIPRPETELLVERALSWIRTGKKEIDALEVLDVGTGCGCIAIALAVSEPELRITATDISSAALEVARRNALKLNVADRITFFETDMIPEPLLNNPFSVITANLPYIPTAALNQLPVYTREPALALDGGPDGLALIRRLLGRAPICLAPGGLMVLEIEASEGPAALALAYDAFDRAEIHLHQDLAGHDRLLEIQRV